MSVGREADSRPGASRLRSPDLPSQTRRPAVPDTTVPASVGVDFDHDNGCTQRLVDQITANGRPSRVVTAATAFALRRDPAVQVVRPSRPNARRSGACRLKPPSKLALGERVALPADFVGQSEGQLDAARRGEGQRRPADNVVGELDVVRIRLGCPDRLQVCGDEADRIRCRRQFLRLRLGAHPMIVGHCRRRS